MDHILLPRHDQQTQQVLEKGTFGESDRWVATQHNSDGIRFKRITDPKPSLFWRVFKAARPISLTATLMPAVATVLLLILSGVSVNYGNAITATIALALLQVAVNVLNDVADYKKLIDLPDTLGGSGVIQQAWLTAHQMSMIAWMAIVLAALFALPAVFSAPIPILICAAVAFVGVMGYSGWPFYFKYKGMGDIIVWLLCGPVLVIGMSSAVSDGYPMSILLLGLFFGFAATAILNANNINDMKVDLACGANTLAIKLGFKKARILQAAYYSGVILSCIALAWIYSSWLLLPLVALPLIINQLKTLYSVEYGWDAKLASIRFDAAKLHLLLGILISVAMTLSIWLT